MVWPPPITVVLLGRRRWRQTNRFSPPLQKNKAERKVESSSGSEDEKDTATRSAHWRTVFAQLLIHIRIIRTLVLFFGSRNRSRNRNRHNTKHNSKDGL